MQKTTRAIRNVKLGVRSLIFSGPDKVELESIMPGCTG